MNAVTLEMLLHCYYRRAPITKTSQTQYDGIRALCQQQMIEQADGVYQVTERGRVHVEALLALPLPVQQWVSVSK